MEVQVREKCSHCEEGRVANWKWQQFYEVEKRREESGQPMFTNEEIVDWFKTQFGFSGTFNQLPSEEEYCSECEGTAITIRWIPIEQLFEKAYPIISKHCNLEKEPVH